MFSVGRLGLIHSLNRSPLVVDPVGFPGIEKEGVFLDAVVKVRESPCHSRESPAGVSKRQFSSFQSE